MLDEGELLFEILPSSWLIRCQQLKLWIWTDGAAGANPSVRVRLEVDMLGFFVCFEPELLLRRTTSHRQCYPPPWRECTLIYQVIGCFCAEQRR